jgi:uroporphyrinogen-III synthase
VSEVIATAEFQGATLTELTKNAIEAFWRYLGEPGPELFNKQYRVVVGTATAGPVQKTLGGVELFRQWEATCHLVSKETAT